jgi:caffeoyl-CoA O-methyltransferase
MKYKKRILLLIIMSVGMMQAYSPADNKLDAGVKSWLKKQSGGWHDYNVPYIDGQTLHDIIIKNRYTSALEIGTSTGHSTIWIAWAMFKTGGKVITIEIDEARYRQAKKNIADAGLSAFVDARLGDAHDLVRKLPGPFDFVFSDADKEWYKQYFIDVDPKLKPGGCFATHNVIDGLASEEYLRYVQTRPDYATTIDRKSRAGIMISYKGTSAH